MSTSSLYTYRLFFTLPSYPDETYTWPNGIIYTAPIKNGMPHGQGSEIYPDGSKYAGQYKVGE